jgi:lysophospholipase L1-like esterase
VAAVAGSLVAGPGSPAGAAKRPPGPLRVLLVGDSLTGNYGPVAAQRLRAKGYEATVVSVRGGGLLDADKCKGKYARKLVKAHRPDVVVYQSKGNYNLLGHVGVRPCRPQVAYGTADFYSRWQKAAAKNETALTKKGARFYWILNPSTDPRFDPSGFIIPELNRIYRKLRPFWVIDAWTPFGGATYDPDLHQADGLHLNAAGSALMADLVVARIG